MPRSEDTSAAARRDTLEPVVFRPPGALSGLRWPRLPWAGILTVALLLMAAAILIYLFSMRAVQFDVTPSHAEVDVAGLPTPRIGGRWLLLAGEHRLWPARRDTGCWISACASRGNRTRSTYWN